MTVPTPATQRAPWRLTALVLLLLLAAVVRGGSYERFLPVLQHVDESYQFIHAYQLREDAPLGDQYGQVEWVQGFPPMQLWVAIASQRWVESQELFPTPDDYIRALRVVSAAMNTLAVAFIALTGWRLARPYGWGAATWAGVLAALPWAVAPRVVGTGNLALMDPLIFPMVALALWFAVVSIQDDNAPAAFGSLLAVITAIYLKYLAVYALWMPFCAVAVLVWRRRWKTLPWLAGMALVSAGTAGWLVFVHQALALQNRESEAFYETGLANMLSPARNLDNLLFTLSESIGVWAFGAVIIGGGVAYGVATRRGLPRPDLRWLALLLPYMLVNLMLTSSVDILRTWDPHWFRVRYTLPTAIGLMLLWGLAAAQITVVLGRSRWRWVVPAAVGAVVLVPSLATHITNARAWAPPHTYERIWAWGDASLVDGSTFLLAEQGQLNRIWNRPWSGYNGGATFRWEFTDTPYDTSPQAWHTRDFDYFAATEVDMQRIYNASQMQPWLDQLLPLKTIPGGPGLPADTTIYRLLPPEHKPQNIVYGDAIQLVGYDLAPANPMAGDVLTFRPYWQAQVRPTTNYSMFVHLLDNPDAPPIVQYDGAPANDARPPLTWTDPNEILLGAQALLSLPADLPAGDYTLAVGLYDFTNGARLQLPDGTDRYLLPLSLGAAP